MDGQVKLALTKAPEIQHLKCGGDEHAADTPTPDIRVTLLGSISRRDFLKYITGAAAIITLFPDLLRLRQIANAYDPNTHFYTMVDYPNGTNLAEVAKSILKDLDVLNQEDPKDYLDKLEQEICDGFGIPYHEKLRQKFLSIRSAIDGSRVSNIQTRMENACGIASLTHVLKILVPSLNIFDVYSALMSTKVNISGNESLPIEWNGACYFGKLLIAVKQALSSSPDTQSGLGEFFGNLGITNQLNLIETDTFFTEYPINGRPPNLSKEAFAKLIFDETLKRVSENQLPVFWLYGQMGGVIDHIFLGVPIGFIFDSEGKVIDVDMYFIDSKPSYYNNEMAEKVYQMTLEERMQKLGLGGPNGYDGYAINKHACFGINLP